VDWQKSVLTPKWIVDWEADVVWTKYGVGEAREGLDDSPVNEIDLVLVPGMGFDRQGGRLGRGGGYYDRFLASSELRGMTCGVCFARQLLPVGGVLPTEPWDVPVKAVVTDAETICCRMEQRGVPKGSGS